MRGVVEVQAPGAMERLWEDSHNRSIAPQGRSWWRMIRSK